MASASEDQHARVWLISNRPAPMFRTISGHGQEALRASFSGDGTKFASGGRDKTVQFYQIDAQGRLRKTCMPPPHRDWVLGLALDSAGRIVATAGTESGATDNAIKIWDFDSCRLIQEINVGSNHIQSVTFSPNNAFLAAVSSDRTVRVWTTSDWQEKWKLQGHAGTVQDAEFDPAPMAVISANTRGITAIWSSPWDLVIRIMLVDAGSYRLATRSKAPRSD